MALEISKYIICKCNQEKFPINPFRLQRYLYLIQVFGDFLFEENFEAWGLGPVVPEVYYEYCLYGLGNIYLFDETPKLDPDTTSIVDVILKFLNKLNCEQLIEMTNGEGSPWAVFFDKHSRNIIPKKAIMEHAIKIKEKYKDNNNTQKEVKEKPMETNDEKVCFATTVNKLETRSQCIRKQVELQAEVKVELSANDIFNWLEACGNADTLRYLGKAALRMANAIENPDNDDFRSRA